MSIRPVWTKEANADCERALTSNAYILNIQGKSMREMGKDFLLTQYLATSFDGHPELMQDINRTKPKYVL